MYTLWESSYVMCLTQQKRQKQKCRFESVASDPSPITHCRQECSLSTCKMGAELAETFQVLPRPQASVLGESGTHNTPRSSPSKRTWCKEVLLPRVAPGATFRSPLVLVQRSSFTNDGSVRAQTSSSFSPVHDTSEMPLLAWVESFSELQCIRSSFPSTLPTLPRCQTWNAFRGWFPPAPSPLLSFAGAPQESACTSHLILGSAPRWPKLQHTLRRWHDLISLSNKPMKWVLLYLPYKYRNKGTEGLS